MFSDLMINVNSDEYMASKGVKGVANGYRDESIRMYLNEIKQIPCLTIDEEEELVKRVKNNDMEAKNKLVESFLR